MPEPTDNAPAGRDATRLLRAVTDGNERAAAELLPLVYGELRRLAQARVAALPPGQTIQATALVHEAYMKLVGDEDPGWNGRAHFFGAAARAMRELLVDNARRRSRLKRGGDRERVVLADAVDPSLGVAISDTHLFALDAALDRLRKDHPRASEVVLLRQFAGLTNPVIAELLDVSRGTIDRDWRFALAWLHKALEGNPPDVAADVG